MLLRDASGTDALPLLQFSLKQLYEMPHPEKLVLTFAAYRALGGLDGAINSVAEEAIRDPGNDGPRRDFVAALPRLLRGLAERVQSANTATAQMALTIRPVTTEALTRGDAVMQTLIQKLYERRLLVLDRNTAGEPTVRIAHERALTDSGGARTASSGRSAPISR